MDKKEIRRQFGKRSPIWKRIIQWNGRKRCRLWFFSKLEKPTNSEIQDRLLYTMPYRVKLQTESFINKWHKTKTIISARNWERFLKLQPITVRITWKQEVFGILEPASNHPVDVSDISLIIVPGVAFDKTGTAWEEVKGITISCWNIRRHVNRNLLRVSAYRWSSLESFDVPMDVVITESKVI